jgi:hypothetical protein
MWLHSLNKKLFHKLCSFEMSKMIKKDSQLFNYWFEESTQFN